MSQTSPDPFESIRADVAAKRDAYLQTIEPHRPELYRYARALTHSPWDAEDLVQETLMRGFNGLGTWSGRVRDLRAYLFRVASNCWVDHQRRRRPALAAPEQLDAPTSGETPALEAGEALERVVIGLPPRERAAVLLKDVFDFSLREIAAALHTTEGAVKAALHRGREKLKRLALPVATEPQPDPEVIAAWIDAFQRKDVDGMLALMTEDCRIVIPGVVDDHGHGMGRSVLTHTLAEKTLQRAERVTWRGETAVALWYRTDDGERIGDVLRIVAEDGAIGRLTSYYYSPDVLEEVAKELGESARTQGYRYENQ